MHKNHSFKVCATTRRARAMAMIAVLIALAWLLPESVWAYGTACAGQTQPTQTFDGYPVFAPNACYGWPVYSTDGKNTNSAGSGVVTEGSPYGYQCTELAERYFYFRWNVALPIGAASDLCSEALPSGAVRTGSPLPGDLMVFGPGSCGADPNYGHVAVVNNVGNGTVDIVEQNGSASGARYGVSQSCACAYIHSPNNVSASAGDSSDRPAVIERKNGEVYVFYPGTDGHKTMRLAHYDAANGWRDWGSMGRWTTGYYSAVEDQVGVLRVYYQDSGNMNLNELRLDSSGWYNYDTGRSITGSPSAVVDSAGTVRVYYHDRGTNSLQEYSLPKGGTWQVASGTCAVCGNQQMWGSPTALFKQNGEVDVFYADASGSNNVNLAYLGSRSGGTWARQSIGAQTNGSVAAIEATIPTSVNPYGMVRVYYGGKSGGHLWEAYWNPSTGQWANWDTGRAITGDAPTAVQQPSGNVAVYYHDSGSNNLQEYYLNTSGWHVNTGSCAVCGVRWLSHSPWALVHANGNTSVFYRDRGDGLVHESWLDGNGWHDQRFSFAGMGP
jgi:hypothetical protein